MRIYPAAAKWFRGFSLMEVIITMGVLATACPLILLGMSSARNSLESSTAEARSLAVVHSCVQELAAVKQGASTFFENPEAPEVFPAIGQWKALGFSKDGKPLQAVEASSYDQGVREGGVSSIAKISRYEMAGSPPSPSQSAIKICIEYPAVAPAAHRQKIEFFIGGDE